MCLAHAGQVKSFTTEDGKKAIVDFNGIEQEVNVELVNVEVGDYIMVHAGFAISKLTQKDFGDLNDLLKDK